MPGTNDDQYGDEGGDDTRDDQNDAEGAGDGGDESTDDNSGDSGSSGKATGEAKRIRDLQSKADSETARANRAEEALKALKRGEGSGAGTDPATKALMTELREASLDAVYGEFAELREYDIDRSLVEGTTRAELRESATALVSLVKKISTKARNKALADAGVRTEPVGDAKRPRKSVNDMSDEEFLKMIDSVN